MSGEDLRGGIQPRPPAMVNDTTILQPGIAHLPKTKNAQQEDDTIASH